MKQKKSKVSKSQVDVVVDRDDTVCLTCGEFYHDSAPGEKWIQCDECKDWAHEDCSNIVNKNFFVCDDCED